MDPGKGRKVEETEMITLSVAHLFVRAAEPGWMVANTVEAEPEVTGLARLLPAALRRRLAARREARQLDLAVQRLASLSPHLLADIGMTDGTLGDDAEAAVIIRLPMPEPQHAAVAAQPVRSPRLLTASVRRPGRVTLGTGAAIPSV